MCGQGWPNVDDMVQNPLLSHGPDVPDIVSMASPVWSELAVVPDRVIHEPVIRDCDII